jgi:precorrin-6B methylase 2
MSQTLNTEELLDLVRGFQPACVLVAAAELDVFTVLKKQSLDAGMVAREVGGDPRATTVLLDALSAMGLLEKKGSLYGVPSGIGEMLCENSPGSVLEMVRHLGNCLRRWGQLARVVKTGSPAERLPSIRGGEADLAAFIHAMDEISRPVADGIVAPLDPSRFRHFLDVGGATGTWTIALLRAAPEARATLFDLPEVIPMARKRLTGENLMDRVTLVEGDFYSDPLPVAGADLVWLSAIVHQSSREQNRALFAKARAALVDGGQIAIRDVVMDASRTRPVMGALFAVNMLVATEGGGTFTFEELREDLLSSGFTGPEFLHRGDLMDSLVVATK